MVYRALRRCVLSRIQSPVFIAISTAMLVGCLPNQTPAGGAVSIVPPVFTSPASATVTEGMSAGFYTATSRTVGEQAVQYSITGGVDASNFDIDESSGELSFAIATNFESPADQNSDNLYEVDLEVEDSIGNASGITVTVEVVNENEAPVIASGSTATIAENNTNALTVSAIDPDGDTVDYRVSGGDDASLFTIDPVRGFLRFTAAPDFDAPGDTGSDNSYRVEISASDPDGLVARADVVIRVTDVSRLIPSLSFPTPNANLGGVSSTAVVGSLFDAEDGQVDNDDISFVDVNGVFATPSISPTDRWSADVPFLTGGGDIVIAAESADGHRQIRSYPVRNEPLLVFPDLIAIGADPDTLLVGDSAGLGSVLSIHLPTGSLSTEVPMSAGIGPEILFPQAAVFDSNTNNIYVLDPDQQALFTVDLGTGDRSEISSAGRGAGPLFEDPLSLSLNTANQRVIVVDATLGAVFSVDPGSGDRTIVSDDLTGIGPPLLLPTAVVFDADNDRLLVADAILGAIVAVDPATGDRVIIADSTSGADLDYPAALALDAVTNRLLVLDINRLSVTAIDLADGSETIISDSINGIGPELSDPLAMAFDSVRSQVLVTDLSLGRVIFIDLSTGNRVPFLPAETGSGPPLLAATSAILDEAGERVILTHAQADGGGILSVDLNSGHRSVLSDETVGTGPQLQNPVAIAIDPTGDRAWVADDASASIVRINLLTGNRSVASGSSVGSGPALGDPLAMVHDAADDRLLVLDGSSNSLLEIDETTGNRNTVSGAGVGGGPVLTAPRLLSIDSSTGRALVADDGLEAMISIDLLSGDRAVVLDLASGSGACDALPSTIAVQADQNSILAAVDADPAVLCRFDLGNGSKTPLGSATDFSSPPVLNAVALLSDLANDRAFILDADIEGLLVVDLQSGQRAVSSR